MDRSGDYAREPDLREAIRYLVCIIERLVEENNLTLASVYAEWLEELSRKW